MHIRVLLLSAPISGTDRTRVQLFWAHVLEQDFASVVHERPFDTACVPLQRLFDRLRLDPRPHRKVAPV